MSTVFLAYPTLPTVPITCILSLNNAIQYASKKHQINFSPIIGESLITRARNTCLRKFLETNCEILLWFDSDIEVLQINTIEKLIEDLETVEFVGGLYSLKDESQRCSSVVTSTKHPTKDYLNKCIWLSTGCWAMRRSVVETMIKNYPDHHYVSDYPEAGHKTYDFFGLMVVEDQNGNRKLLSEDWAWCLRYTSIGGNIWADTRIILAHHGYKSYTLQTIKQEPTSVPEPGFDFQ